MGYRWYGENAAAPVSGLALAEIGAPQKWVTVSLQSEEQRAAGYASLNPQRKLPTRLTPSGEVLTVAALSPGEGRRAGSARAPACPVDETAAMLQ